MRRRFLFLLPFLAALTILFWTSGASAHAGHDMAMHAQPALTSVLVTVAHAATPDTSHHCHARCHGCTAECQMQCAAAAAIPVSFDMRLSHGRHRIEPQAVAAMRGWQAAGPQDPPRPSA